MPGFVYILYSEKLQRTYVGSTENVLRRLSEHNEGRTSYTRRGLPWRIWHTIEYETIEEARTMEKYYKSGAGRKKLRVILSNISK